MYYVVFLVETLGQIFRQTKKVRKQTRTLERRSRHQLGKLRRALTGLATQVTEELYAGRRQLQEIQEERGRAEDLQKMAKKRAQQYHEAGLNAGIEEQNKSTRRDEAPGLGDAALAGQLATAPQEHQAELDAGIEEEASDEAEDAGP